MSEPFSVARIDDVQSGPGVEGSTWFRVRLHFGISAFGVNGFRADAGQRVIEEHNEVGTSAGRHEELYVGDGGFDYLHGITDEDARVERRC